MSLLEADKPDDEARGHDRAFHPSVIEDRIIRSVLAPASPSKSGMAAASGRLRQKRFGM